MGSKRVVIIGAGYVGASICYALSLKEIADEIVIIDTNEERAFGEVLDICHGIPYMGITNVRLGKYSDCAEASMIIITAGRNRRKGQSRMDLLDENLSILKSIINELRPFYKDQVVLMVSNPVDMLTYHASKLLGREDGRIFGTGCMLDTSRLVSALSDYLKLSTDNINAMIVGEHGDNQMVVWSRATASNATLEEYCDQMGLPWNDTIKAELLKKVHDMGAEIIRRKERTHYGIATCVCYLADAVVNNHSIIAPVSTVLHGQYSITDAALSVPTIVNDKGAATVIEEEWSEGEYISLNLK